MTVSYMKPLQKQIVYHVGKHSFQGHILPPQNLTGERIAVHPLSHHWAVLLPHSFSPLTSNADNQLNQPYYLLALNIFCKNTTE